MLESNTHQSLAVIALKRGDFDSAENHLLRARTIAEFLAPDGIQTILAIANLAVLYQDQGRLQEAEQLYLKVLDKEEKHFPSSSHLENTLKDLGVLYDQQGDLARAEAYHRKALSVAEHLDPDSLDVAEHPRRSRRVYGGAGKSGSCGDIPEQGTINSGETQPRRFARRIQPRRTLKPERKEKTQRSIVKTGLLTKMFRAHTRCCSRQRSFSLCPLQIAMHSLATRDSNNPLYFLLLWIGLQNAQRQ
jgi:tetratricopeptide (TPR) repeat protein